MPEAYRPGLPVLSDEERLRRNAIQQEWSNPFQNESIDQRPSMASLYEDEPTTEELLAQARGTLDSTADNARLVAGAGEIGRRGITSGPQSAEMHAPKPEYGYGDVAKDTLVGAAMPASFLAGPVGIGAGVIQGIDALANGNLMGAGFAAVPAIRPAMKALRGWKAASQLNKAENAGNVAEDVLAAADDMTPPPSYKLGPEKSLEDILGSPSIASLRDDIAEGSGRGLGTPTGASVAPNGPKVRAFSEGEEHGIESLGLLEDALHGPDAVLGPGGRYMSPEEAERLKQMAQSLLGPNPSPSALRMTAQEALESGDEAAKRSVLFGGSSSRVEGGYGDYVRPKDRTPIGTRPLRRGEGGESIQWNRP